MGPQASKNRQTSGCSNRWCRRNLVAVTWACSVDLCCFAPNAVRLRSTMPVLRLQHNAKTMAMPFTPAVHERWRRIRTWSTTASAHLRPSTLNSDLCHGQSRQTQTASSTSPSCWTEGVRWTEKE